MECRYPVKNQAEVTARLAGSRFSFTPTEARWSVLEQELFGCFYAVKRWAPMLLGAKFTILTDHKNILQLHKSVVPKIVRWRLQMQPFEYTVKHVPGPENVVADCLSRLHGKSQRAIVSSGAVLLPDGSYAQDGEFEPDRATVELICSFHNCEVGHHGVNRTVQSIQAAVARWRNCHGTCGSMCNGLCQDVLCVRSSRARRLAARLHMKQSR